MMTMGIEDIELKNSAMLALRGGRESQSRRQRRKRERGREREGQWEGQVGKGEERKRMGEEKTERRETERGRGRGKEASKRVMGDGKREWKGKGTDKAEQRWMQCSIKQRKV